MVPKAAFGIAVRGVSLADERDGSASLRVGDGGKDGGNSKHGQLDQQRRLPRGHLGVEGPRGSVDVKRPNSFRVEPTLLHVQKTPDSGAAIVPEQSDLDDSRRVAIYVHSNVCQFLVRVDNECGDIQRTDNKAKVQGRTEGALRLLLNRTDSDAACGFENDEQAVLVQEQPVSGRAREGS